jgi:hypothetical protein
MGSDASLTVRNVKNKMTDKERIINRLQNLAIEKCLDMENCQDIADVYEKHFYKNTKNIVSKQEKQND